MSEAHAELHSLCRLGEKKIKKEDARKIVDWALKNSFKPCSNGRFIKQAQGKERIIESCRE